MIVVGCGRGQSHVRSLLAQPDRFELVGLVDIDQQRLKTTIRNLELPDHLAYTSYSQALEESGCNGVVIATWARTHDELVEAAIEAGKHVMVEKPFVLQLAPDQRLTEMAEARGLKIVITQQWRYMPGQRTVRRLMTERAYGEPQTGHMLTYKARGSECPDSDHSQLWQMTADGEPACSRSVRPLLLPTSNDLAPRIHGHRRNYFRQRCVLCDCLYFRRPREQQRIPR